MRHRFSVFTVLSALILAIIFVVYPKGEVSAEIADGSYQVNYEMKENNSENTSIADGYFSSPATLTVENGVQYIQLTVTSSDMIKSLSAPSGPVDVVSEDTANDTRTVKFKVDGDLSQPVSMDMNIVVPDMPAMPGGYDKDHTARAVFDVSGLPEAGDEPASSDNNDEPANAGGGASDSNGGSSDGGEESAVDNPQTGDDTLIALYVVLLLASLGGFIFYKVRTARN